MTSEQREAIEDVEEFNNKFDCGKYRKSIDTVLSLIKEQQEEIEKKDKQIDLMAESIEKVTVDMKIAFGENMLWDRREIKQYFARLVEKE